MSKEPNQDFEIVTSDRPGVRREHLTKPDPGATPFKTVIDPKLRHDLRRALIELIERWRRILPRANSRSNPTRNTSSSFPAV
jgi:hypothetical protein